MTEKPKGTLQGTWHVFSRIRPSSVHKRTKSGFRGSDQSRLGCGHSHFPPSLASVGVAPLAKEQVRGGKPPQLYVMCALGGSVTPSPWPFSLTPHVPWLPLLIMDGGSLSELVHVGFRCWSERMLMQGVGGGQVGFTVSFIHAETEGSGGDGCGDREVAGGRACGVGPEGGKERAEDRRAHQGEAHRGCAGAFEVAGAA